jgi:hypothetical protein
VTTFAGDIARVEDGGARVRRGTIDPAALAGVETCTVVTIAPGLPVVDYILRTGFNLRISSIYPILWMKRGRLGMLGRSARLFVLGRS